MRHQQNSTFFFFNDTATTEIYTLSLHDALPICPKRKLNAVLRKLGHDVEEEVAPPTPKSQEEDEGDRKSTRLNSSHLVISYAVFCLKKKNYQFSIFTSASDRRFRPSFFPYLCTG